jgi:hypothetical protein
MHVVDISALRKLLTKFFNVASFGQIYLKMLKIFVRNVIDVKG